MKIISQDGARFVLSAAVGEDIMEELKKFAQARGTKAAWVSCIGAVDDLELAVYSKERKGYETREFREQLELTSGTGNITSVDGEVFVHLHGVFGNAAFQAVTGHVKRAVVSAACEIFLEELNCAIERELDEDTGLHLMR